MGARCRAHDWSRSPLGPTEGWSQSLRTVSHLVLGSAFPKIVLWGPDLVQLYNDSYAPIMGVKHPWGLGRPTREVWPEAWSFNEPIYDRVRAGDTVALQDQLYRLATRGPDSPLEEVFLTISYSSVLGDDGAVGGVLVTMIDTTDAVRGRVAAAALAESEARLRLAVEVAELGTWEWEPDTDRVTFDRYARELFGLDRDGWLMRRDILASRIHPEDRERVAAALAGAVDPAGPGRYHSEYRVLHPDGKVRWALAGGQALFAGDGASRRPARVVGTLLDVTGTRRTQHALEAARSQLEDQQAELEATNDQLQENALKLSAQAEALEHANAALRLREDHLARVFAQAPVAVCVIRGHDLVVELANPLFQHIVPRVLVGRPLGEALPEIDAQGYAALLRGVRETGEPWTGYGVELEYDRHGTGTLERAYFNALYFPLVEAGGARVGVIAVVVEVTEEVLARREVERLLRESERVAVALRAGEQRLRDVFEQSPVAVAVLEGPDHVYTIASPRYRESPGGGRPLLGRKFREAFPELKGTGYPETMDRVYQTGEPFSATELLVMLDSDGDGVPEERYFNVGYQPLRDVDGNVYAISSVAYDVTTHVVARREVDAARAEADAANKAKSDFLAAMSHELRTPLNAIGGYTDLISLGVHGPVTDAQQEALARVQRSNQHLLSLISDVLSFAKLEAGRVEYTAEFVRLADLVAEVMPMVEPQLSAKGLSATVEVDPSLMAWADPDAVRQIALNLLSNAVKFTVHGGVIVDAAQRDGAPGEIYMRFTDSGIGIPDKKHDTIFDPFVQVRRGLTRQVDGTGLGLAISRDLARGMGGELRVRSVEGKGSTFTLTLPTSPRSSGEPLQADPVKSSADRSPALGAGPWQARS